MTLSLGAELVEGHLAPCGRAGELEVQLGEFSIPPPGRRYDLVEATSHELLSLTGSAHKIGRHGGNTHGEPREGLPGPRRRSRSPDV